MDFKLKMLPLEDGGTCVLDYDEDMQDFMEKCLVECGREDLILCSVSLYFEPEKCSLHLISENTDLNDWWNACKKISDEY